MSKFEKFIEFIKIPIRPFYSWIFPLCYLYGWFMDYPKEKMEMLKPIVMIVIMFWFGERMLNKYGGGLLDKILQIFKRG